MQLWTCNKNPPAKAEAKLKESEIMVFPSNPEPYTYNTSTYGGMILAKTKEDPRQILKFIKKEVEPAISKDLGDFEAYYTLFPREYHELTSMIQTKFEELFGMVFPYMTYTDEQTKHAKDVIVPANTASIEFGNLTHHVRIAESIRIPLPKKASIGSVFFISYYVMGRLQRSKPSYFKDNISNYCKDASKNFGKPIQIISKF
jgi:hypothetical protein